MVLVKSMSIERVKIPSEYGRSKKNIKKTLNSFKMIIKKLSENSNRKYSQSLYLEVINQALRDNDRVLVFGDMLLIDGGHCNFEKGKFCQVYDFYKKIGCKRVCYKRFPKRNQNTKTIDAVQKWWNYSLYRDKSLKDECRSNMFEYVFFE